MFGGVVGVKLALAWLGGVNVVLLVLWRVLTPPLCREGGALVGLTTLCLGGIKSRCHFRLGEWLDMGRG